MRWIATCGRGLEALLESELEELGLESKDRETGGVAFDGTFADGLAANWRLRSAGSADSTSSSERQSSPTAFSMALWTVARRRMP